MNATSTAPQPPGRRRNFQRLRRRAYKLAQASYADYLATLSEVAEARGIEAALAWSPADDEQHMARASSAAAEDSGRRLPEELE